MNNVHIALFHCSLYRLIKEIFFSVHHFAIADVHSWHAAAYVAEDFVVDGSCSVGKFFYRDELVSLAAKEHYFITGSAVGFSGDINHALVHADIPNLGYPVSMEEYIHFAGEYTHVSVRISYGQNSNLSPLVTGKMAAIADGSPFINQFDMGCAAAEGHNRAEVKSFQGYIRAWCTAVLTISR